MLGLLILLIISWLLLHNSMGEKLKVLGFYPIKKSLIQFVIGFFVIALISLISIYIETLVLKTKWQLNTINFSTLASSFWYHLKSALTEDLVFRGALLYVLIHKIGSNKAILLSAIVFGIYHWFSYGIINERLIVLIYVFLITGFTGYVWAYSFFKTKSMMLGLGFHLGVNFINSCFFESQPYGQLLFEEITKLSLRDWNWLWFNLFKGLFPSIMTLLFVIQYLKQQSKTTNTN